MTKKARIATIFFLFVIFAFLAYKNYVSQNQSSNSLNKTPSPTPEIKSLSIVIDTGEEKIQDTFEIKEETSALEILQKTAGENNIELETQKYDFGTFVKSINGLESSSYVAWIYFVNGKPGEVAADLYTLSPGDIVEWKYTKPN